MKKHPLIIWHASKFQIVTGLFRGYYIVDYGDGTSGLYMRWFTNSFGTPLACRGPRDQIDEMANEVLGR